MGFHFLHHLLHNTFPWYRHWHEGYYHRHVHWGLFILSLFVAASLIYSSILKTIEQAKAGNITVAASSVNSIVLLDVIVPDAWNNESRTADIVKKTGVNSFFQGDVLNDIPSDVLYKEDGVAGFQGTEAVVRDLDADGVYTTIADTVVDCDGATTTDAGACGAISAGATLVSMSSNNLDFNNDGAADGRPLCADSLTSPTKVAKDKNASCANGAQGEAILGINGASLKTTVTNKWAFVDLDGDSLLDLGEDLYIEETAGKTTYSAIPDVNVYATSGLAAGDATASFAADCDGADVGLGPCRFTGSDIIDETESILVDESNQNIVDKQADQLTGLGVRNLGTAVAITDILAIKLWVEEGTMPGFEPTQDILLGVMIAGSNNEWRLSDLAQQIPASGQRIYVTADISAMPTNDATLNFTIPIYNDINNDKTADTDGDVGYFVSSNNQKPSIDIVGENTFIIDTLAPVLNEVTPINQTTDLTPDYVFNTTESGTINYSGDCTGVTNSALAGENTVTFDPLGVGIHGNCAITIADSVGNISLPLQISSFEILAEPAPDETPPVLLNFNSGAVDGTYGPGSLINITAHYDKILSSGSLTIVLDNEVQTQVILNNVSGQTISGNYTVGSLNSGEDTTDLTIKTILNENVSDQNANNQTASIIPISNNLGNNNNIAIDVTAPVINEIAAPAPAITDPTPNYLFISYESGVINYGGSCATLPPSPATAIANTETLVTFGPLSDNAYGDCTLSVTDEAQNQSNVLNIPSFTIDTAPPSGLSEFSADESTLTTQVLSWLPASDIHFDHYEIWYGIIKADVIARTGTAMEWDGSNDSLLGNASTTTTTITGLNQSTLYYYKIFAFDSFGNGLALPSISAATESPVPPSSGGGGGGGGGVSFGGVFIVESEPELELESELEAEPLPEPETKPETEQEIKPDQKTEPELVSAETPKTNEAVVTDPLDNPAVLAAIKKIPQIKLLMTLSRGLKFGYVGEEVKVLQKFFNAIGIVVAKTGPGAPGKETRRFGYSTLDAVRKFQLKYGLVKSSKDIAFGYVGPATRAKIKEVLKKIK